GGGGGGGSGGGGGGGAQVPQFNDPLHPSGHVPHDLPSDVHVCGMQTPPQSGPTQGLPGPPTRLNEHVVHTSPGAPTKFFEQSMKSTWYSRVLSHGSAPI